MIVHLTASPCFGGPERQMLELGRHLAPTFRSAYVTFREEERCWEFVRRASEIGIEVLVLRHDTPNLICAHRELKGVIARLSTSVLVCHGYKAGILGRIVARSLGIPIIGVSRGWTAESFRVRVFEWLDRSNLRLMDKVVCVSESQARRVRESGVASKRVDVIRNAIRTERFSGRPELQYRAKLEALFPEPPVHIIGAAGRLSREKGFDLLIEACNRVVADAQDRMGVVVFGDGILREQLTRQIDSSDIEGDVVLAGFTDELDRYMPHFDVFVQSSHTEGLPNVLLEAAAAGIPVVATDVGGTGEVVADGETGLLVRPNDVSALASGVLRLLGDATLRRKMAESGPDYVARGFTFERQAHAYCELLETLIP